MDSTLFVVPLLLTGLTTVGVVVAGGWTGQAVFDAVADVVAAVALWLRRRWPVGLALGLFPLAAVASMAALPATIAVFSVAVHRRLVVALWGSRSRLLQARTR